MKTKIKPFTYLILFCIIQIGFTSCKKDNALPNSDYRDIYIGNYLFKTVRHIDYNYFYLTPPSHNVIIDTIYYTGLIEKYETNKLKITFRPNSKEPDFQYQTFPISINGLVYPSLNDSGIIVYPEASEYYFAGKFIGTDSIYFSFAEEENVGTESDKIYGRKINKK